MRSSEVAAWTASAPLPTSPRYKRSRVWRWGQQTWLGDLSRGSRKFCREMSAWLSCGPVRFPDVTELAESIASLRTCGLDTTASEIEEEAPIFLLSTGWRAGSTLLQRILITDQRLLLWGEPLGEMAIISRITEMVSHSMSPLKLRVWESQVDASSSVLATSWIANLYPPSSSLRRALRSLVNEWLAKPARERGFVPETLVFRGAEQGIARGVAVQIVDRLELIEIDHQHRDRLAALIGPTTSKLGASDSAPAEGTSPAVGLSPTTPQ